MKSKTVPDQKKLFVAAVLIIAAVFNIGFPIIKNLNLFTERFDPKLYEKKYNDSQYVIPQSKHPISDEELDSYAGYKYATGLNPILINSDHPPFGKYLIGWSILLTGNNRVISIAFAVGNVMLVALIVFMISGSLLLSSLGVLFISLDSMLIDQIIHSPILDIIQVFFLLLYVAIFLWWQKNPSLKKSVTLGIVIGCLSSIKLYFPALVLLGTVFIFLLWTGKTLLKTTAVVLSQFIIGAAVYTLTYLRFLLAGNSLRAFFGAQKWIFLFWKNNSVQSSRFIGDASTLMIANRWKVWWGSSPYIQFEHWNILWPVFSIFGIGSALYIIGLYFYFSRHKLKQIPDLAPYLFLSFWVIASFLYLNMLPISPRYVMIFFFPVYILLPLVIQLLVRNVFKFHIARQIK